MNIGSVVVGLPDLNQSVPQRRAIAAEYAPVQPGHLTNGGREVVVDADEIVIQIERHPVGIVWPNRLSGREDKLFGEEPALG